MNNNESLSIGTDTRPPILQMGEYQQWKDRFLDFVERYKDGDLIIKSILEGPQSFIKTFQQTPRETHL